MRLAGFRHVFALLVLGVMVFWTTPRTVFHECAKQNAHHKDEHARSVRADEHCSICELAVPPMVQDAQVFTSGCCSLLLGEVTGWSATFSVPDPIERTGRGPPVLL